MAQSLTQKILSKHLVSHSSLPKPGEETGFRIDQTLTQDATGTMAYLQFESMDLDSVKTKVSVSYVDHNMLQTGFENADDHRYLQSVAAKYGLHFSRPGNGICHQVHRERFGVPGDTLLGSDSHTPTCGGLGMIAIGAGGLDIAMALAGQPFYTPMPKVLGVKLTGKLNDWVTGKDVILEMLRRLTVKGGTGRIVEYYGEGAHNLSIGDRFTICNMGAELGATTSIFPSDEKTLTFLKAQKRENVWQSLKADDGAEFDENIEINLSELEPLIAQPHMPDNVVKVRDVAGTPIAQACVGSCTNSSYHDLSVSAYILKDKVVNPAVSFTLTPGSKQVFEMIARDADTTLANLIRSGARVLESACGPCIGMGQAPPSGAVSVRSFNRNFEGRSGTADAKVYLASPETCAASALTGVITDPRDLKLPFKHIDEPKEYIVNDDMLIAPPADHSKVSILRGPNIKPLPSFTAVPDDLHGKVLLKMGDNITTDHIMPAGAKVLPLRSNIPAISEFTLVRVDPEFPKRAKEWGGGMLVGGENYGQGSSREHAALAPRFLGVSAVIVKSFARIHLANLINFGILPATFVNAADYDSIAQGDELVIENARGQIAEHPESITLTNKTKNLSYTITSPLTERQRHIILAGGTLAYAKQQAEKVAA
ncbi:MAG TPA: aconitate hydratase [Candidatus Kapabacteria bacterium]|nr:aconitate hydratase [Candidatus Kapabacteria bacterium]